MKPNPGAPGGRKCGSPVLSQSEAFSAFAKASARQAGDGIFFDFWGFLLDLLKVVVIMMGICLIYSHRGQPDRSGLSSGSSRGHYRLSAEGAEGAD